MRRGLSPVRTRLSNGAVVVAAASPATPAVTVHLSCGAGAVFDPPGQEGAAFYLSRTVDRGTTTRSAEVIADALEGRGIVLNAAVNRHVLSMVCTCLVEDLDATLDLLGDIVMRPSLPEAEITVRRSEVVTVLRQDQDNPAVVAVDGIFADLFGAAHPYSRPPRGTIAGVERIDRAGLLAFHAERVRPPGLSLVLVGDIDPHVATESAAAVFGAWTGAAAPAAEFPDVPQPHGRRLRTVPMMSKAQADIAYGFTTVPRSDPSYYAYRLMNHVLGEYAMGGRIGEQVREKQGMAYYAFSSFDATVVPGPLLVRAGVSPANVERAVAAIDGEMAALAREGPTDEEVEDSRQYLIGSMPRMLETNAGIAAFLQTAEFFDLGLDYDQRLPDLLRAVTRDEVHAAAEQVLRPERATVVIAGPYECAQPSGETSAAVAGGSRS